MQDASSAFNLPGQAAEFNAALASAHDAIAGSRFEEATQIAQDILRQRPGTASATSVLAIVAYQKGQIQQAIELMREAIQQDPSSLDAIAWLSNLLRTNKQFEDAMDMSRRLIDIAPARSDGYFCLGLCCLEQGQAFNALSCFQKAVLIDPGNPEYHYYHGIILNEVVRVEDSIKAFRQAISLAPQTAVYQRALAKVYFDHKKIEEGLVCQAKAVELEPSRDGYLLLAAAETERGRFDGAGAYCGKAIQIDPSFGPSYERLGFAHLIRGRFEEAETVLKKAIKVEPNLGRPYMGITGARKITETDLPMIAKMEELVKSPNTSKEDLRHLYYGLGKAYSDLSRYEEAMAAYDKANQYAGETEAKGNIYNHQEHERWTDLQIATYTGKFFRSHLDVGNPSPKPIFILGMIRSGTTLTEQILSSHPEVGAAGELSFWTDPAQAKLGNLLTRGMAPRPNLIKAAASYLELLNEISPNSLRVTDKMPMNLLAIGLIHLLLPNARIIHCRRDPIDTCLSIWMTPNVEAFAFGHSRQNIVDGYRSYLRIMEHWRRVIPADRLMEIDYEDMVDDREPVVRRMVDFCGLEWDEACLQHEKNERMVRTPSLWQARQPIYRTSLEKWRRYEPWLHEFASLADLTGVSICAQK